MTPCSRPAPRPYEHTLLAARAWQPEEKLRTDAAGAPRALCWSLVGRADALHQMVSFVGHRIFGPDGAVILGCALHSWLHAMAGPAFGGSSPPVRAR
jgi:hypothetical protein